MGGNGMKLDTEFASSLQSAVKKLTIPTKQHKSFISDACNVADWIDESLKERESIFHGCLTNLKQTATYTCGNIVDIPADFNCYLLLELPFFFFATLCEDGNIYLRTNGMNDMLASSTGLQQRLRSDLNSLMSLKPVVKCKTGRSYQLCYHCATYPVTAHTIVAKQLRGREAREARITFEFLVAVKMPFKHHLSPPCLPEPLRGMSHWVSHPVPHFDRFFNGKSYLAGTHLWQLASRHQRENLRVLVRLLYILSLHLVTLSTVSSHMIKHMCINRFEFCGVDYPNRPLTAQLIDIMRILGTNRLDAFNIICESGYIINYAAHSSLERDCIKWDMLTRVFTLYMTMKNMPVTQFLWFFGLSDQTPPKLPKSKRNRKGKKK